MIISKNKTNKVSLNHEFITSCRNVNSTSKSAKTVNTSQNNMFNFVFNSKDGGGGRF